MTYTQAIDKCSQLYQSTYGTKTVEQMNENYREFKKYQKDAATHFNVDIKQVEKDSNSKWTEQYYNKT